MKFDQEVKNAPAGFYARAAATDASVRNLTNKKFYSATQIRDIESAKTALEYVAYNGKFYINYRKKFAAIKIDGASIKNKKAAAELDAYYKSRGWTKVRSTNTKSIIFRMPRIIK